MWTLDENPNCEKTYVSFRLVGDRLHPETVERSTGLAPDFAAAKGEVRRTRSGREIRQPTGVWSVTSEGRVDSTSAEQHLIYLLDKLEPVKESLLALAREQYVAADFFCYWVSATDNGGPGVGPDTLRRISGLDAILGFDLYGAYNG